MTKRHRRMKKGGGGTRVFSRKYLGTPRKTQMSMDVNVAPRRSHFVTPELIVITLYHKYQYIHLY